MARKALEERFWDKVEPQDSGCWHWTAARFPFGYGLIKIDGSNRCAHRVSYQLHYGVDPADKKVCHRCDNPQCVRPSHLFLGSQADNLKDMWAKGRARPVARPGELNGRAKLSNAQVEEALSQRATGETYRAIATRYGVSPDTIRYWARNRGIQKRTE